MRSILLLIILSINTSCYTHSPIAVSARDSVRVEIRTRTEYVRDTIFREIPLIFEKITTKDTSSHLENLYAKSYASINRDGTLFHSLATKPQREPIPIDRSIQYRDSIIYRDKVVKETVQVEKELSWWQKMQMKGFWMMVCIILISCRKKLIGIIGKII